jgi:hypothetical protein
MTIDGRRFKRKKRLCSLEMKLNIINDYKKGIKIKDLNKKYKINICNINYWVKNEKNFKMTKYLSKKTIHSGAFKKILLDENEVLSKIDLMFRDKQKINTTIIFDLLKKNYPICNQLKDCHIKSWIYRFISKYHLKTRYFEKKKKIDIDFSDNSFIDKQEIETIEYNRLNNKPFYIEKVIVFGEKITN